jgi:Hg(II)-responsive transcriptional regulator
MGSNGSRIGTIASQAGVNVQTLRYYERRGLLAKPDRTPSGYRHYSADTVKVVRFIKRAQDLGFTLREIQDLLRLQRASFKDRKRVRDIAVTKISDIDERITRLSAVRTALARLVESCDCGDAKLECSILDALNGDCGEDGVEPCASQRVPPVA